MTRNQQIFQRFINGERQKLLAHVFGLGERHIKRIVAECKGKKVNRSNGEKEAMDKQCNRVLEHLEQHGRITQFEAIVQLGILRLASRIHDLKNKGHAIHKRMVKVSNRFGESCSVAEYRLAK